MTPNEDEAIIFVSPLRLLYPSRMRKSKGFWMVFVTAVHVVTAVPVGCRVRRDTQERRVVKHGYEQNAAGSLGRSHTGDTGVHSIGEKGRGGGLCQKQNCPSACRFDEQLQ